MRIPLIAGNWKLHKTLDESAQLVRTLVADLADLHDREIVVAPVFTALATVAAAVNGSTLRLAAQNCYPATTGAYTGEVSPLLLKDVGCSYVIVGHSERRQLLGENDAFINQKAKACIAAGLKVILCIGETLVERETDRMLDVLNRQVSDGLNGISADEMAGVVIAYEPVWAIGTGVTASDEQAQETHAFVRGLLQGLYNPEIAATTRIIYGGSVKPNNIDGLMAQEDIDGALVGGASLKAEDFIRIARFV